MPPKVDHRPAELAQQPSDRVLGLIVVARDEHVRLVAGKARIDHDVRLDDVEALDDVRAGDHTLDAFAERVSGADE